ncbi:TPA: efflux RND transporter periplasmic adaptor subunit [Candidatus Latescibacteria bacterium]|nr:efflux RND transporter periplasmic adaptor subunit [Candidatus Latescibacterota bacterium]|tara:strand:- start:333 stop:1571 length:1239 start_codon:yes stop_codon:yes gene_type:complete
MTPIRWIIASAICLTAAGIWLFAPSEDPHAGHDQIEDVSHYTCPMHPSVKLHDPDVPCPICGMDLTPVPKQSGSSVETFKGPAFVTLSDDQQQLIGIRTDVVAVRETAGEIRTQGRITYDERSLTDVNLKVSGWIRELFVNYVGKRVRRGDQLFTLYSPDLLSSQEEYLLAFRGQNDGAESGWNERLLASARERLQLWDMTNEQIHDLEQSGQPQTAVTIHSPADGIVIDRKAVAGMHVNPSTRLYRIAGLDTVWVMADVYEQEIQRVREGLAARVLVPGAGQVEGRIDYVYPYLDPSTRTGTVRILVANPEDKLKPDTFVDVLINVERSRALIVPESAVMLSGRRRIAFLAIGEGRFQPTEVRLGRRYETGYEMIDGLQAGDVVVTPANFLLDSESKLRNVETTMLESTGP